MAEITSPCIRNCCLDEHDICVGCFRSIDEILHWRDASEQQQKDIIVAAKARKTAYELKYNPRDNRDADQ